MRRIRDGLRNVFLAAIRVEWKKKFDELKNVKRYGDGRRKSLSSMNSAEVANFRSLQKELAKLEKIAERSICSCVSCGRGDRDMVYNKSYDSWYCTECYNGHRLYAKELFQTIGKTKPQGHEEEVIHELYESFLDFEEAHEIELGLVKEGVLIYLLRFHHYLGSSPYATLSEIQGVLCRSREIIVHVLNSLERNGLIDLLPSANDIKARLKKHGVEEANNALIKSKRFMGVNNAFPEDLEDFHLLLDLRSDKLEYDNPELIETLIRELKSDKTPPEEIRRKVEELKVNLGF
ncbi:MAG TPA: hypothetical protein ENI29_20785 [bacterium]|nr:hypothetical protein [bacterium]